MEHQLIEKVVNAADFVRLREVAGLSPRSYDAAKQGLPNSLFGVQIRVGEQTIAMGRVVGDGALNFEIVDVAVDPYYQGNGFGRLIMQSIMDYLDRAAFKGAYITLMADVPELYSKFGFQLSRPASEGMYIIK
ncbi:GNAT family N-acetyltransferase [Shewanella gelidimarina]|uniref:GNAT family N-acetyltransferase n=1 Tax=Shewanella gelidimarina TaxID=56813 RepID=UPI00200BD09A|nr:GNAT family N-acetyltransferase [Shewanella gelidimarina]MCL1059126.1 GNAT family N-acetyltransferase [Shewanella gelidimarina]